jgi:hypothetical protein
MDAEKLRIIEAQRCETLGAAGPSPSAPGDAVHEEGSSSASAYLRDAPHRCIVSRERAAVSPGQSRVIPAAAAVGAILRVDFSPRGTLVPLWGSEAEPSPRFGCGSAALWNTFVIVIWTRQNPQRMMLSRDRQGSGLTNFA